MRQSCPSWTRAWPRCLPDLADRGLLDSTIVWCCGEFGRTPKVAWEPPWNGGRDHYGKVLLRAGGRRRLQGRPRGRRLRRQGRDGQGPARLSRATCIGSMYELMGIDPDGKLPHPQGLVGPRHAPAADGVPTGGRLREIM